MLTKHLGVTIIRTLILTLTVNISKTSALAWSPISATRIVSANRRQSSMSKSMRLNRFIPEVSYLKMSSEGQISNLNEGKIFNLKKSLQKSMNRFTLVYLSLFRGMTVRFPGLNKIVVQVKDAGETDLSGFNIYESAIYISTYLALGVGAYSFVLPERWSIIDSLYFCVCTLTTIGHGDLVPIAQVSKAFTCFFACGGIACLSLALASIGSNLIEGQQRAQAEAGKEEQMVLSSQSGYIFWKAVTSWISVLSIGGLILGFLEGWSLIDSIYYSIITSVTLGYGDFTPTRPLTRLISVIFDPVVVAASGNVFGSFAAFLLDRRRNNAFQKNIESDLSIEDIKLMDVDESGEVSKDEYIAFMLVNLKIVDKGILDTILAQFDKFDVTGDGCLSEDDITKVQLERKLDDIDYRRQMTL